MRILLLGPVPETSRTAGVQEFNIFLAQSLAELGHRVDIALPQSGLHAYDATRNAAETTGCRIFCLDGTLLDPRFSKTMFEQLAIDNLSRAFQPYDQIIVSGAGFHYARILRAAVGQNVTIWTHGQQISPFLHWDGAELTQPGVNYVCINQTHFMEAKVRGFDDRAAMADIPVLYPPAEVLPAGDFSVAVGNLEQRKNYPAVAEFAKALRTTTGKTRVYGNVVHERAKAVVDGSKWLEHRGYVPHSQLQNETAEAGFILHAAKIEGFPAALREANAQGIPVITWDIPLYRDGLNPTRNILLNPKRPVAEQLAEIDLKPYRSMINRMALAEETRAKYGKEAFMVRLVELLSAA